MRAPDVIASPDEPRLPRGYKLGRYVIIGPLGRGGMGIVYKAFDPELDRRIAVKLLARTPAHTAREQDRLLREGKAMARLSHPHVAAVYDVGTHEDRVFVAMELVEGETLRAWLRSPRSWREILKTFAQAGRGLAAAHDVGIVHRDFKPDNALVGDDGRVRVVDFGLAWTGETLPPGNAPPPGEQCGAPSISAASSTSRVGSMVGTPRYSPPEQLQGERVDARADQFAFCASLWEALFGRAPFDGDDPLTRLATIRSGKLTDPPAGGIPGRVREALRRGLAARPGERHPSMSALLEALERDPSVARRRWAGAAGIVALFVGLAVGARAVDASRARERALLCTGGGAKLDPVWGPEQRGAIEAALTASGKPWAGQTAALVTGVLEGYGREWKAMHREACEATSVRHEQSEALLDLRMQCLDARLEELRALVTLLSRPDDSLIQSAPKAVYALAPVRGCADTKALLAPLSTPDDPAARAQVDAIRIGLAQVHAMRGLARFHDGELLASQLATQAQSLRYAPLEAEVLHARADILEELSEYPRAVDEYRKALWAAERGRDSRRAAAVMIDLVWVLAVNLGRYEPAHDYASQATALIAGGGGDAELQGTLDAFQGSMLVEEGKLAEAETIERIALAERLAVFGPAHPRVAAALTNLGVLLDEQGGHAAESLALSEAALAVYRSVVGEHHPDFASALQNVAASLKDVGRVEDAKAAGERAVAIFVDALGPEHGKVANAEASLALTEMQWGDYAAAERLLRHAVAVTERLRGTDNPWVANHRVSLATALAKQHRYEEALALYRSGAAILAHDGDNAYWAYRARSRMGDALLGLRRPVEALSELEAVMRWQADNEHDPRELGQTRLALARALWATGNGRGRARRLAEQAAADFASSPATQTRLVETKQWLADPSSLPP